MRYTAPRHLLVGAGFSSWCGIYRVHDRGLAATRDEKRMSCGNCRRSLKAFRHREAIREAKAPKNVTPRS
jgi:hypothetical protein